MSLWHYISDMFYRREKPHELRFDERISNLKKFGIETKQLSGGRVMVSRGPIGATVTDVAAAAPRVDKPGLLIGDEVGLLVHGGYQMFFITPSGKRRPALADQLKALHDFEEDLKEGLGLISLYNEGLGSICELHMYDRVEDRDHGGPRKVFPAK